MNMRPLFATGFLMVLALEACPQAVAPPAGGAPVNLPFPKITFEVQVEEQKNPGDDAVRAILAFGKTEYPPGTNLVMEARLKGAGEYLDKRLQFLVDESQHFDVGIDDLGGNVFKGDYEVRLSFDPQQQAAP